MVVQDLIDILSATGQIPSEKQVGEVKSNNLLMLPIKNYEQKSASQMVWILLNNYYNQVYRSIDSFSLQRGRYE